MSNDAAIWIGWKIIGISIAVLIMSGVGAFIYGATEEWHDTGTVTWLSVGQKQFYDDVQGIAFWYTPYSFVVTTGHGSVNFTDPYNQHPCSYCHISGDKPILNQPVALVKHHNGNYDLYLDP